MEREQLMSGFKKEKDITPEYLNRKMESMMQALYDSIEESEKRMRIMEKQIFELKRGKTEE